ncbi:hypothetical protein O181_098553 [Austropuccinia psidii MF-1]|uniref:Uncharacterized protein n=1 Tax=Austropuccinia psidii MF-1 TaxID=1389203 RepID=A0A9Q3JB17_9BASI|nr:hypothetical protein [Austropuccinia psidii MF-1]
MGQALLKELPKIKEWPHFSGEGEYENMEFIRGIEMIKKDFELPNRLGTARFNNLFTKSAHRWYLKLRLAHGHQSWTWWKTKITNKWDNVAWRFKVEAAFESEKLNADKDKALPCRRFINILEEVTTRTKIGSSRVNLKGRFNTPWKNSVDKNPKESPNNVEYKPAEIIRNCHIFQSTTHLANTCPKRGKINEIDIKKEPDVEKDNNIEENSYDKSSIFSESSKDIENINAAFDIMESYSHLPQLSNGQLYLSKFQDAQLMKTKPNRGKGYTACNSCITEVVIYSEPTKRLHDAGAFFSCVGKSFFKTCVPNFEEHLLPSYGIKFNSASNPMKALGIFGTNVIFQHINGNLRITFEFFVMENCSSTHFILATDYLMMYGLELHNRKVRYFTIGDNKHQKISFLPFKIHITVSKVAAINLELERGKYERLNEAEISLHLNDNQ